jgi:hypothetical protein
MAVPAGRVPTTDTDVAPPGITPEVSVVGGWAAERQGARRLARARVGGGAGHR